MEEAVSPGQEGSRGTAPKDLPMFLEGLVNPVKASCGSFPFFNS
jgi:hypothetical protein